MTTTDSIRTTKKRASSTRVLKLYLRLREDELTVPQMMDEFGVSRRTVYGDLRAIEDAGIHLINDRDGPYATWRVVGGRRRFQ